MKLSASIDTNQSQSGKWDGQTCYSTKERVAKNYTQVKNFIWIQPKELNKQEGRKKRYCDDFWKPYILEQRTITSNPKR